MVLVYCPRCARFTRRKPRLWWVSVEAEQTRVEVFLLFCEDRPCRAGGEKARARDFLTVALWLSDGLGP